MAKAAIVQAFTVYEFAREGFAMTEQMLADYEFTKVGKHHLKHVGLVRNVDGDFITTLSNGVRMLTYRSQQKKVNKAEVLRRLKDKVIEKEEEFERKLKKGEKDALTQAIIEGIIPETFPDASKDIVVMFTKIRDTEVMIVGGGSWKASEDVTALIRKACGSLPIVPCETNILPEELMTQMVEDRSKTANHKYTLGEKISMVDSEGYDIKLGKGSVYNAPVQSHLEAGATVILLELVYDGIISFVLNDKFEFKSVKISSDLKEIHEAEENEQQLDAEALGIIAMSYVAQMFDNIVEVMDGLQSEG
jgi:recombination associated protein RdgC